MDAYPDGYTHGNAYLDSYPDSYTHGNAHLDSYPDGYAHGHTNEYAFPYYILQSLPAPDNEDLGASTAV
jgi:hypothetical protein